MEPKTLRRKKVGEEHNTDTIYARFHTPLLMINETNNSKGKEVKSDRAIHIRCARH